MLNFPTEMKLIPVVPLQTNPLVFSNCKEIRFPVSWLNDAVPRLIGLVLRLEPAGLYQK